MSRVKVVVGFAEPATETAPGVWTEFINTHKYSGTVLRDTRKLQAEDGVNSNVLIRNRLSIVSDAYGMVNYHSIRYVDWENNLWDVSAITVDTPRLTLTIGGLYNGPTEG